MGLVDHITRCNVKDLSKFLPFYIEQFHVGWIYRKNLMHLDIFSDTFNIYPNFVALNEKLDNFENRSAIFAEICNSLEKKGLIKGWRGENYPVTLGLDHPPLMQIERAAASFFGIRAYGIHLNGYVKHTNGLMMWIAKRSLDKQVAPGKLDNMVAGGQPIGMSLKDNLIKEAREEAALSAHLALLAKPVGLISYLTEYNYGLRHDFLFTYDLELPKDFVPKNNDGEVEEFYLWPVDFIKNKLEETFDFKFNTALVLIDFFIRHGLLDPDEEKNYDTLIRGLRTSF
ncbi:MAG: DUF4743 domain-containing protein [Alphaproteobacteria bacterium]|nr:DUF4743 domain-containing protein [Alphaproteobacteria bacterium]